MIGANGHPGRSWRDSAASGLGADLAMALDPVLFARSLELYLDDWQAGVARSAARGVLLLAGRQVGKSTTAALLAAHTAIYKPGSTSVLAAPSLRQTLELARSVRSLLTTAGAAPGSASLQRLELASGSRILSLPATESTVRGIAGVDQLILDEAAWLPDEVVTALLPMTATTGGRVVAMSTPSIRSGWFFEQWVEDGEWHRVEIWSRDCARIDPSWLEGQRRTMTPQAYASEFECQFGDPSSAAFRLEDIKAAMEDVEQWLV